MKLIYQSYGSSILLFIQGQNNEEAYGKWLSLANWGATSLLNGEEPEFVTEGVISCWSTIENLRKYLFNIRIGQLAGEAFKGKRNGAAHEAMQLAKADFDNIERETYRSVGGDLVEHSFGTITAEKPDENLTDYFITRGLQG